LGHGQSCTPVTLRPRRLMVHPVGFAPTFRAYRARVLLLDEECMERPAGSAPAISSLAPRRLAGSTMAAIVFWLPGQESNPRRAVSRTALRTDTECLAVVLGRGFEPPSPK